MNVRKGRVGAPKKGCFLSLGISLLFFIRDYYVRERKKNRGMAG